MMRADWLETICCQQFFCSVYFIKVITPAQPRSRVHSRSLNSQPLFGSFQDPLPKETSVRTSRKCIYHVFTIVCRLVIFYFLLFFFLSFLSLSLIFFFFLYQFFLLFFFVSFFFFLQVFSEDEKISNRPLSWTRTAPIKLGKTQKQNTPLERANQN